MDFGGSPFSDKHLSGDSEDDEKHLQSSSRKVYGNDGLPFGNSLQFAIENGSWTVKIYLFQSDFPVCYVTFSRYSE